MDKPSKRVARAARKTAKSAAADKRSEASERRRGFTPRRPRHSAPNVYNIHGDKAVFSGLKVTKVTPLRTRTLRTHGRGRVHGGQDHNDANEPIPGGHKSMAVGQENPTALESGLGGKPTLGLSKRMCDYAQFCGLLS